MSGLRLTFLLAANVIFNCQILGVLINSYGKTSSILYRIKRVSQTLQCKVKKQYYNMILGGLHVSTHRVIVRPSRHRSIYIINNALWDPQRLQYVE
jgi:hypothetical protein